MSDGLERIDSGADRSKTAGMGARILLKARPLPEQLADRLSEPVPDGLELYLDAVDLAGSEPLPLSDGFEAGDGWLGVLEERIAGLKLPPDFVWVVEGPLRSLDGAFFDVSRPTPANVEVIRRLTSFGRAIGARAAVIHAMALVDDARSFSDEANERALRASLELLRLYAGLCESNGLIATIENIPAVAKMREARFMHSIIGMEPRDMLFLCRQVEGLRITLDVSHAQLYLNAAGADLSPGRGSGLETPTLRGARRGATPAEVIPLVKYLARRREVANLDEYIDLIEPLLAEVHFSNASGLLGEGLPYGQGDLDLDRLAVRLSRVASFLVTETLEPDPNHATFMREAQLRMKAAIGGGRGLDGAMD